MANSNLWVVVPFYNEARLIKRTLAALDHQTDKKFQLVLIDNGSSDNSRAIINQYLKDHPTMHATVIRENQKGTGAAADTGFRYAIKHGATHIARTDADTMPQTDWTQNIKRHFKNGALIMGGKLKPRTDEPFYTWRDGLIIPFLIKISERAPRLFHRHPANNYPMFMIPGLNMAIESNLYIHAGGFPRSSIDDTDEDLVLHLAVCKLIRGDQAHFAKDVVVYGSIRKVKAFGYIGILLWYWDRKIKPSVVDVR